jgi:hypothetical protein
MAGIACASFLYFILNIDHLSKSAKGANIVFFVLWLNNKNATQRKSL